MGATSVLTGVELKSAADVVEFVQRELSARADGKKAVEMAAYMKTAMPFYGVQKPDRVPVARTLHRAFRPKSRKSYEEAVLALWNQPHREEKYFALGVACHYGEFIAPPSLKLYERLIREGAWWDFVDEIAIRLVGGVLIAHRPQVRHLMDRWIGDGNMWIRRAALLSQNKHRRLTDETSLFRHCLTLAPETEFFIRKGIGWALREYSYAAPAGVRRFLKDHKSDLSPLSYREGAKALIRRRMMS